MTRKGGRLVKAAGRVSGWLPRPRQVTPALRTQWELEEAEKRKQKFNDPAMVPKGSVADPTEKRYPTPEEKLAGAARAPRSNKSDVRSERQQEKQLLAEMRRTYLAESLKKQEKEDRRLVQRRERAFKEAQEARLRAGEHRESEATLLTMPTIESFLEGKFIEPLSEEQKEELRLKREANRKNAELRRAELRASQMLEIYQQSDKYILTPEELDAHVDREFATLNRIQPSSLTDWKARYVAEDSRSAAAPSNNWLDVLAGMHEVTAQKRERLLRALTGTTVNGYPGLPRVEAALKGEPFIAEDAPEPEQAQSSA